MTSVAVDRPPDAHRGRIPLIVALLVVVLATLSVGARTMTACDGQLGCVLAAGDRFTDPTQVDLPVTEGDGYDGQFFYRQVRSPFDFSMSRSNGVEFDTEVRYGRIGYPVVAWVLSAGGQPAAVPWAMVTVGVLSLGALGWVLASAAADARRSAWWGLLACAMPGAWFAAGRGLADPLSTALVGAAVLALTRRRHGWAALAFTAAALTKEQAVVVPAVYGLWRLWEMARTRVGDQQASATGPSQLDPPGPGRADLPWVVPGVVFVVWQLVLVVATGTTSAGKASGAHLVLPFTDLVPAALDWLSPSGVSEVLWLVELVSFIALAVLVAVSASSAPWERWMGVVAILFVAVLNDNVFVDPAHFRQVGELSVVILIVAFRADPRWWIPMVGANAAATLGVIARLSAAI